MLLKEEPLGQVRDFMTTHLEDLIEYVDAYGWDTVKFYNAAWLNQLALYGSDWSDGEARMTLRRALEWHATSTMKSMGLGTTGALKRTRPTQSPPMVALQNSAQKHVMNSMTVVV